MGHRIYVGNLSYDTGDARLRELFESEGHTVTDIHVVTDRETGRSRGFAFVEVETPEMLSSAISGLDGRDLDGRKLSISEARPRAPREGGGRPPGRGGPPERRGGPGGGGGGRGFGGPRSSGPPVQERRRRFDPNGGGGGGGGRGRFDDGGSGFGDRPPPPPPDGAPWGGDGVDPRAARRRKKWDKPVQVEGTESAEDRKRTGNNKKGGKRGRGGRFDDDFEDW